MKKVYTNIDDSSHLEFLNRLESFRRDSQDETSMINFFDEHDILPLTLTTDKLDKGECLSRAIKHIGVPRNYGLSYKALLAQKEQERLVAVKKEEAVAIATQEREKIEFERRAVVATELVCAHAR